MAEIPIERKSGSRSWIWIVALLAIALLAWMFLGNDDDAAPATQTTGEVGTAPATLLAPSTGPITIAVPARAA